MVHFSIKKGLISSLILVWQLGSVYCETTTDGKKDYIVVFHPDLSQEERESHHSWIRRDIAPDSFSESESGDDDSVQSSTLSSAVKGHFHFDSTFSGYHGAFSKREIDQIVKAPEVARVEEDSIERVQGEIFDQSEAPWGISRLSYLENPIADYSSPSSLSDQEYRFRSEAGKDVTIYILDTGCLTDHQEYSDRFRWGANYADDINTDQNGHGTHVAGVAAGSSVGVAKYSEIVAVKILDAHQTGSLSNFLKALDWIIEDHSSKNGSKAVINYSAVGEVSDTRDTAIQKVLDAGIFFVGAAGNSDTDACQVGPGNLGSSREGLLIVAALNYTDKPALFTNYGSCVNVYAPGVSILSSYYKSAISYALMSGSSMSAPHVSGLVAYYWSINPDYRFSDISDLITNYNTGRIVNATDNTVNKIAYNNVS